MALKDSLLSISNSIVTNQFMLKVVTAVIILLVGFVIGRIAGKLILKLLKEIDFDKTIKKTTGYEGSTARIISRSLSYLIYFLSILVALESLGLSAFILNMILLAIIMIIVISFLLAIKDFIPNFIAGFTVRRNNLFNKGDKIKVGSVEGKILKISLLDTHVVTPKKDLVVVPNSYFTKNLVIKKK